MTNKESSSTVYPVEWLVGGATILTALLFLWFGVPLRNPSELYLSRLTNWIWLYLAGLLVLLLLRRLRDIRSARTGRGITRRETYEAFAVAYLSLERTMFAVRLMNVASLLFVTFIHLKHLVPVVNPQMLSKESIFDGALLRAEETVFGGKLIGEWMLQLIGVGPAGIFSRGYTLFYPYVALLLLIFLLQSNRELSLRFYFAFALVWLIGILVVAVLPTWGPCFFAPDSFSALQWSGVGIMQARLWELKQRVELSPVGHSGVFMISGLPSLHVAVVILGSIALRSISRVVAACSWAFAIITIFTTLYFGWHYIWDDIAALLLIAAVLRLAPLNSISRESYNASVRS